MMAGGLGPRGDECNETLQKTFGLTRTESEVARWLSGGKTNWEIGLILSIGVRTVEKHVERVLQKIHVENRTAAAVRIVELVLQRSAD
jgi:DNA-binding CsgD family transcriptional regulator